jgi:plastocyanin
MMRIQVATMVVFATILAAACGGGEQKSSNDSTATQATGTPAENSTATATHPASPGGTALVPSATAGATVLVTVGENTLAVQQTSIAPGPTVFTITNTGKDVHNIFIDGPGVQQAAGSEIPVGATTSVTVNLQAGEYEIYCPMFDHRQRGETAQVTVGK